MEISRCSDCLSDISSHGKNQYYIVDNSIWRLAMKKGRAVELCVECLEKRIERNLTSDDFKICVLNYRAMFRKDTSEKLKNRLGNKFTSSVDFKIQIVKEYSLLRLRTKQYELHKEVYDRSEKKLIELADK